MKREYKFRSWIVEDELMLSWDDIDGSDQSGSIIFLDMLKDELNYKVMQWTGLCDKNGKEIYEGDIIQTVFNGQKDNWLVEEIGVLERDNRHYGICVSPNGNGVNYFMDKSILSGEVIGNIYENKDLIS